MRQRVGDVFVGVAVEQVVRRLHGIIKIIVGFADMIDFDQGMVIFDALAVMAQSDQFHAPDFAAADDRNDLECDGFVGDILRQINLAVSTATAEFNDGIIGKYVVGFEKMFRAG
ncbi:hypothetical protein SDC9_127103 [bioreactor metagenome]|uniref:Uncharacterized protein n=1 Tax=bioreactor metagenome TaxID=1076179 RepID=A0A645CT73_9ZZZZ